MKRSGGRLEAAGPLDSPGARLLAGLLGRADARARDESAPEPARLDAIALLGCVPLDRARDPLARLLDSRSSGVIQAAALRALAAASDPQVAGLVLEHYPELAPPARAEAVATLLARTTWTLALLDALRAGAVDRLSLDSTQRAFLLGHKNSEIATRARSLFGESAPVSSAAVLAAFAPALKRTGDAARGSQVFDRLCITCHRLGNRGHTVGPDLTATQFREPEPLLTHILDPNLYVAPGDIQYIVSDQSGRTFTGLIASETASSLTLRRAEGAEDTILRSQIEALRSTGKSLMPEDFAAQLTQDDAADLLAFLLQTRSARPGGERLDIGTLPGRVEPEGPR